MPVFSGYFRGLPPSDTKRHVSYAFEISGLYVIDMCKDKTTVAPPGCTQPQASGPMSGSRSIRTACNCGKCLPSGTAPKPPQQDLTDIKGTPIFFSPEIHQLPRGQGRGMLSFVEQHAMRRSGLFFPRRHVGVRNLHLYDVMQRLTVRRQFVHKHELWQCCRCSSFHEGRQHVEQGTLCH